jgi:hypothetical protein
MFPRTRSIAAAALLTAAALYVPGHVHADQDDAQGRVTGGAGNAARRTSNLYIVQMAEQPVVSNTGGVAGQPATKPNRGQKIDPLSAAVVGYAGYLDQRHDQALAGVGGARKVYDYHYSFNGFAAELSDAQAAALRAAAGVVTVTRTKRCSPTPRRLRRSSDSTRPAACGISWVERRGPATKSSSASSTPASGPRA